MSRTEHGIDWQPWGEEAFQQAKRLGRPILLDIGATWCHWCHVMEETSYADEEVVRIVNEFFVPVKVDRDRNPEIDRRYQHAVALTTGEGGWPLTAILTPAGTLITGGTYFPPRDAGGRPGLRRLLKEAHSRWRENPEASPADTPAPVPPSKSSSTKSPDETERRRFLTNVAESLTMSYDDMGGGFGMAPKFPHPMALSLAYALHFTGDGDRMQEIATETLRRMAEGGIYDHLGGGFHRYSVDRGWHIPHFEKIATDNAFLLRAYLDAYAVTKEPLFLETLEGILRYVTDTLALKHGGFASSQDADYTPGDDGRFYTWTKVELKALLTQEEYRVVQRRFGVGTEGMMPHDPDQNVLFTLFSVDEIAKALSLQEGDVRALLASSTEKMRKARGLRKAPAVDLARYSSVNGYLAGAVAAAGAMLDRKDLIELAQKALEPFLTKDLGTRGVPHEVPAKGTGVGHGLLEDQASMLSGLVDVSEASGEPTYLAAARQLSDLIWTKFRDGETGLLADLAQDLYDGHLPQGTEESSFPLEDNPHISPNASVALSFLRLSALTGDSVHSERARQLVDASLPRISGAGLFASGTAMAGLLADLPVVTVMIGGSGKNAKELLRSARGCYHPTKIVMRADGSEGFHVPEGSMAQLTSDGKDPVALVCVGNRCLPPARDVPGLMDALAKAK